LIHVGRLVSLDPAAAALVLALAALLARGTAQSASVNATVTLVSLFAALYVLAAGAPLASAANLTPFFPGGARGVFGAASIVFFAFVGFDTVAAAAEEARDPAADLPFAILVSVAAAALLYAALAAVLVAAVPRAAVDHGAPFAAMFSHAAARAASPAGRVLLATSARFVSFGALTGILTAGLVTQLGVARVVVFLARERLLPVALAAVDPGTGAPAAATWAANGVAAALALTTDLGDLAALVSVGTLSVFLAVAAAVLKRRHSPPGGGARSSAALVALLASSAAVSAALTFGAPAAGAAAAGVAWCASAGAFYLLPVSYLPSGFRVPLAPLTPALAVLATVHLALSLGTPAYVRLAVWTGVACLFYACFSVHSADAADAAGGRAAVAAADAGDAVSLELALASLPPPPRRGASGDDRARLLTVVRLASDDGLAEPRTPAAGLRLEVPPTPTGGVGSSAASSRRSSVGEEGGGGRRGGGGASRLSQ
jgi:APA family basic amino acid/polyamine antiporter